MFYFLCPDKNLVTTNQISPPFPEPDDNSSSIVWKHTHIKRVPRAHAWTSPAQDPASGASLTPARLTEKVLSTTCFDWILSLPLWVTPVPLGLCNISEVLALLTEIPTWWALLLVSPPYPNFCHTASGFVTILNAKMKPGLLEIHILNELCYSLLVLLSSGPQRNWYLERELKKNKFWFKNSQVRQ